MTQVWLLTIPSHVQGLKNELRTLHVSDRNTKVIRDCDAADFAVLSDGGPPSARIAAIPTSLELGDIGLQNTESMILSPDSIDRNLRAWSLKLDKLIEDGKAATAVLKQARPPPLIPETNGIVQATVRQWLQSLPREVLAKLACSAEDLYSGSWRFMSYPPLLLFSAPTFGSPSWKASWPILEPHLPVLYGRLCEHTSTTHIALSSPIPPDRGKGTDQGKRDACPNALRAPLGLQPLYGGFGSRDDPADEHGFAHALWVSTRQNGILQIWAPLHTMFSRGNIKEKGRVLSFPDVKGNTAVDLYAGIGYFAFSYVKAGARKVLCWEINPWSVEGLRRGAEANRWRTTIARCGEKTKGAENQGSTDGTELLVFLEDNASAVQVIRSRRNELPPVRHVNLGFLPSSSGLWRDAVEMLDLNAGGWIHTHENVAAHNVERRTVEVGRIMDGWCRAVHRPAGDVVRCEHVERVKSFAPGVLHCVFDVFVGPITRTRESSG